MLRGCGQCCNNYSSAQDSETTYFDLPPYSISSSMRLMLLKSMWKTTI